MIEAYRSALLDLQLDDIQVSQSRSALLDLQLNDIQVSQSRQRGPVDKTVCQAGVTR